MSDLTVANTIWQQISVGVKMACGVRDAVAGPDKLQFRVTIQPRQHHSIVVKYEATTDLYRVELWDCGRKETRVIAGTRMSLPTAPGLLRELDGVYADMLGRVIYDWCNKDPLPAQPIRVGFSD